MSRLDRWLMIAAGVIVIVVPLPFLFAGRWPITGLAITDVVGFGLQGFVVVRAFRRAWTARGLALKAQREALEAERSLDERLELLLLRRGPPRGPLS